VEKHRKAQEDEKQLWLSKCLAALRSAEAKLLDLDTKEVQARREFSGLGNPSQDAPVNAARFWMLDQFIQGQKVHRAALKKQLQVEEQEVGMAYREFMKAQQQRKIMEKLRERRQAQYNVAFKKHEARQQDEMYVMRARLVKEEDSHEE
ncbi:MAG: flagellar export protein FliJ, partial [Proteobacteria bacterium]